MNTTESRLQTKSYANHDKRYGRPQIIRVLVSTYLADLREAKMAVRRS